MSNNPRRKLLKSIAAGSGAIVAGKSMPETWSRPVVNSIMLPAHAQTTQGQLLLTGSSGNDNASNHINKQMYQNIASDKAGTLERITSNFISNANAGPSCDDNSSDEDSRDEKRPDEWACYAEKLEEPLNEPDGEWALYVKQSKFKSNCDCPTQERAWKANVMYGGTESEEASVLTYDDCGFGNADKHGELEFILKDAVGNPHIQVIELVGGNKPGKTFNLDVFLFDGGQKPEILCCDMEY